MQQTKNLKRRYTLKEAALAAMDQLRLYLRGARAPIPPYARPENASFVELLHELAALGVESFGRIIDKLAASVVGGKYGRPKARIGVVHERLLRIVLPSSSTSFVSPRSQELARVCVTNAHP